MNYKVWQYNKVVKEFPTKWQALIYCLIGNFLNKIKKVKEKWQQ